MGKCLFKTTTHGISSPEPWYTGDWGEGSTGVGTPEEIRQSGKDFAKKVNDFVNTNCEKISACAETLAGMPDTLNENIPSNLMFHASKKIDETINEALGMPSTEGAPSIQTGHGYAGYLYYKEYGTEALLKRMTGWNHIGHPGEVAYTGPKLEAIVGGKDSWKWIQKSGYGVDYMDELYRYSKSMKESIEKNGSIGEILKNAPDAKDRAAWAREALTETKSALEKMLIWVRTPAFAGSKNNPLQDDGTLAMKSRDMGWKDAHIIDAEPGSLKTVIGQIDSALVSLKAIETAAKCLADFKETYDKMFADEAARLGDMMTKLAAKAQTERRGNLAELCKTDTSVMCRAYLEAENLLKAWKDPPKFEEQLDVIPESVSGKVMPRTFKEQCLLLANVHTIAHYKAYGLEADATTPKKLAYFGNDKNACIMAQREPWGFMNQLVQDPSYGSFFDIKTEHLSQLAPMIRLFKIEEVIGRTGNQLQTPVTFDTHYNAANDLENITKNRDKRGFGVGLKSFNFSYEGSNPFAVKKSIKAKLVIVASSFDDLLVPRQSTAGGTWRYADLALKTGGNLKEFLDRTNQSADALVSNVSKLNFRLKAVIGWQMPANFDKYGSRTPVNKADWAALTTAINNSFVTLNLTPTIHEFDIDDMGRVVFTINYLAYIEDFFDQPNFNIFASATNQIRALQRKIRISAWEEHCDSEETSKLKKAEFKKIAGEKEDNLNKIMQKLLEKKKVLFVPIMHEQKARFNELGPFFDFKLANTTPAPLGEGEITKTATTLKEALKTEFEAYKEKKDLTTTPIADMNKTDYIKFFYLSDLVDVVLENVEGGLEEMLNLLTKGVAAPKGLNKSSDLKWADIIKSEKHRLRLLLYNFQHFRVILGPMEVYDFKTGKGRYGKSDRGLNLGDLPISVSYFMDWLTDKVQKRDSPVYTLSVFLNDLLNGLVRNFLNDDRCHDLNIKQKTRVFQSVVTSYKKKSKTDQYDEMTQMILDARNKSKDKFIKNAGKLWMKDLKEILPSARSTGILNVMGARDSPINTRTLNQEYNYLVYYAGRVQPSEKMNGIKAQDHSHGIFHYMIGKPQGIVKNIQLIKTDSPGLKEVRFEQEGYDGLSQLREVYDAKITCYGSPNIVPGTYIYVDPKGFAPKDHAGKYTYAHAALGREQRIDTMMLTRYGIGGYYMVIKAENSLGPGEFNTTITAKWVAELGAGDATQKGPKPSKCRIAETGTPNP